MSEIKTRGERLQELLNKPENSKKAPKYLAEKTDKSKQYIYKLLNDEIKNADSKALKIIADELGVSLDYLEFGEVNSLDRMVCFEDPVVYNHLPPDLKHFVNDSESKPYLVLAQHLSKCDLDRLTESDMKFLIDVLKMHKENHNKPLE
jgi:transcriptional regulator with XRE-family HTH domain